MACGSGSSDHRQLWWLITDRDKRFTTVISSSDYVSLSIIIDHDLSVMHTLCDMGVVEQITDAYSNCDHYDSNDQSTTYNIISNQHFIHNCMWNKVIMIIDIHLLLCTINLEGPFPSYPALQLQMKCLCGEHCLYSYASQGCIHPRLLYSNSNYY